PRDGRRGECRDRSRRGAGPHRAASRRERRGGDARVRHRRLRDRGGRDVGAADGQARDPARSRRRSLRAPRPAGVRARGAGRVRFRGIDAVIETETPPERAFLVGVEIPRARLDGDDSLDELASLVEAAGGIIAGRSLQARRTRDPNSYVGKGKADEIGREVSRLRADIVICDDELKPSQQRTLEEITGVAVIDRSAVILEIFARHARTREGRLQVELAQLEYRLPRLAGRGTELSRLGGGSQSAGIASAGGAIGVRGPGETKLEIDRRRIRSRIAELREEIEKVRERRLIHRRQRASQTIPVAAVVGYTNAGKSTLFNALTEAEVLTENKLFATLDPTTRRVMLPGNQEILLTDTVGFIQKLPTRLIAAFRATLEEVIDADLLLEVVDISHENAIEQSETVNQALHDLAVDEKPR